jgi:hypothetical protein
VLTAFASVYGGTAKPIRKRRKMSAPSRKKIAAPESMLGQVQSKAEEVAAGVRVRRIWCLLRGP